MFFAMYSVGLSCTPAKSPNPVMTKWTIAICLCPYRADIRLIGFLSATPMIPVFPLPPYAVLMMTMDILMRCALHDVMRGASRMTGI